jgi:arylformamidase
MPPNSLATLHRNSLTMKLIDLSVVVNEQTPVFPGDAPTKIEPANRLERDGNNDHYISMNNHAGTHIDAPWHVIDGGKRLDEVTLDKFIGNGRLITLTNGEFNLQTIQQAGRGRYGWRRRYWPDDYSPNSAGQQCTCY